VDAVPSFLLWECRRESDPTWRGLTLCGYQPAQGRWQGECTPYVGDTRHIRFRCVAGPVWEVEQGVTASGPWGPVQSFFVVCSPFGVAGHFNPPLLDDMLFRVYSP